MCFLVMSSNSSCEGNISSNPNAKENGLSPPHKADVHVFFIEDLEVFLQLLEEPVIRDFLVHDCCNVMADNYLLAKVFVYFVKAKLEHSSYTRFNFFTALYLAHAIYEDDETIKERLLPWAKSIFYKDDCGSLSTNLWHIAKAMGFRTIVSRSSCETVMSKIPDHYAWKRIRPKEHGGASETNLCDRCKFKVENVSIVHSIDGYDDSNNESLTNESIESRSSDDVELDSNNLSCNDNNEKNMLKNKLNDKSRCHPSGNRKRLKREP